MGGRREVSVIFYRPVTRSDLKQERSFFRGSVSSYLQLVVAVDKKQKPLSWTASSLLFFFAKLLHAKPKHASGEAGNREKRGRLCNNNVVVWNRAG